MKNPLNVDRLGKGIDALQAGLQGRFSGAFVSVLAEAVKDYTLAEWTGCIEILLKGTTKAPDLTVGDFLEALQEVRHGKALHDNVWKCRPPGSSKRPDWKKMSEAICADPMANDLSKSIIRGLATRKEAEAPPPVVGGEKYRRSKS